jgi:hypothetical protein
MFFEIQGQAGPGLTHGFFFLRRFFQEAVDVHRDKITRSFNELRATEATSEPIYLLRRARRILSVPNPAFPLGCSQGSFFGAFTSSSADFGCQSLGIGR